MKRKDVVALSGSHGFLGTHLKTALEKAGLTVYPITRFDLYSIPALAHTLEVIAPDYIFHLAAFGNMSHQTDEKQIFDGNLVTTFNLLMATKTVHYKAFVNVSTSSVTLPNKTLYAATKGGAELLCRSFVDTYDKPIVSVRPYSIYGPGEAEYRFIPTVFRSCMEGEPIVLAPDAVHDWVYVDDFIEGMMFAAYNVYIFKGQDVSVGTGTGTKNVDIVRIIEKITGRKAHITDKKTLRSFDTKNWTAPQKDPYMRTIEEGLKLYYEWYTLRKKGGGNI